jgi:hypothetical protein
VGVRGVGAEMRRGRIFGACVTLSLSLAGCAGLDDPSFSTRDGVGAKLHWTAMAEETVLLEQYVTYICQQADLIPSGEFTECNVLPSQWPIFVQAGMNDIDRRCDAFLSYIDYIRRSRTHWLNQLSQTLSTTSAILGATNGSMKSMEIVTAAFGFATGTLTNATERLLTLAEHSTVQSVVLGEQRKLRGDIQRLGFAINNRPAAIHALRNYLRICMPMTIEQQINSTVTIYQQSGGVGLDQRNSDPLIVPTVVSAVPVVPRQQIIRQERTIVIDASHQHILKNPAKPKDQVNPALAKLCIDPTKVTANTQDYVKVYQQAKTLSVTGTLSDSDLAKLQNEPDCKPNGVRNFYENNSMPDGIRTTQIIDQMNQFLEPHRKLNREATADEVRNRIGDLRNKFKSRLTLNTTQLCDQFTRELRNEMALQDVARRANRTLSPLANTSSTDPCPVVPTPAATSPVDGAPASPTAPGNGGARNQR